MKFLISVFLITLILIVKEADADADEIIIVIPGWGGDVHQVNYLAKKIGGKVIVPSVQLPLSTAADDIFAQLEADIDKEIILIGFSFGGILIREFAGRYPELKIKKIIQIGTPNKMVPKFFFKPLQSKIPFYIIAGNKGNNKWFLNKEENDGEVSVDSVMSVDIKKDSKIFYLNHKELIQSPEVVKLIINWLSE